LEVSGYPDAEAMYAGHWHDVSLPFEKAHFLDGFAHADGRFHFAPDWSQYGPGHAKMPRLPDHFDVIDDRDEEHPHRLVTAPSRSYLNSTFAETPSSIKREGRPEAQIHPGVCAELGLARGDLVRLGNERGTIVVHVRPYDGVQRGTVIVEGIWPNKAFVEGIGTNALTSAEPGYPNGGAVFHDTAVWLRPA
ncbi:MAG: molybdopterin dinucleotide binding domain-containing protein, partial [Alphaproteobacteria bacterium]